MTVPAETDVLVVGGGNAALCAAIAARESGARVLVLEHAPHVMRGGNTRHTRNLRVSHSGPAHTLTDSYSDEAFWQDLLRVTEGHTNEALARQMIEAWHVGEDDVIFMSHKEGSFNGCTPIDFNQFTQNRLDLKDAAEADGIARNDSSASGWLVPNCALPTATPIWRRP